MFCNYMLICSKNFIAVFTNKLNVRFEDQKNLKHKKKQLRKFSVALHSNVQRQLVLQQYYTAFRKII